MIDSRVSIMTISAQYQLDSVILHRIVYNRHSCYSFVTLPLQREDPPTMLVNNNAGRPQQLQYNVGEGLGVMGGDGMNVSPNT